ncbi:IS5 family transposase [Thiorhodospira sibirica]|uniref:IS5 family transposase n=1 Tax=Thiorhodospira sibirica TaxID=154347 RepID=UPI001C8EA85C|nr:IS5 family transposase [Thiorhodospira sibirica]
MRHTYPSDLRREPFEQIRALLESGRKKTAPRRVDLYDVFCAVLYRLGTGCQWRALPSEYPKWRTVHHSFTIWSEPREGGSLLEQALKKNQVSAARKKQGRNASATRLIVDAQSVKNADTAEHKGYDAGKKVSGIKRPVAVDTQGLPHAVAVTTAEVTDRQGAVQALARCKTGLGCVPSVLADGGYTGRPFAEHVQKTLGEHVTVHIAKRSELHTFKVIPTRWVVERSFAWLEKHRRFWKNAERTLNTRLPFVHWAFLCLLLKRL